MKAYQLEVTLQGSEPLNWRRIIVPSKISFGDLDRIIKKILGFSMFNSYCIMLNSTNVAFFSDMNEIINDVHGFGYERECKVGKDCVIDNYLKSKSQFQYIYDDIWIADIIVESVKRNYEYRYPTLIDSNDYFLIEDAGDIWESNEVIEILSNPASSDYKEVVKVFGNLEKYKLDKEELNKDLEANFVFYIEGKVNDKNNSNIININDLKNKKKQSMNDIDDEDRYDMEELNKRLEEINSNLSPDEENLLGRMRRKLELEARHNMFENEEWNTDIMCTITETSLEDLLEQSFPKREMVLLAESFDFPNPARYNKSNLAKNLSQHMLKLEVAYQKFMVANDDDIKIIDKLMKNSNNIYQAEAENENNIDFWINKGYAFYSLDVEDLLVKFPKEVIDLYKTINTPQLKKDRKYYGEILRYFKAMDYLYGVTPIEKILELYNAYHKEKIDADKLLNAFSVLAPEQIEILFIDGYFMREEMAMDNRYIQYLDSIKDVPYYIPSKNQMENIGNAPYIENTPAIQKIKKRVQKELKFDSEQTCEFIYDMQEAIRSSDENNLDEICCMYDLEEAMEIKPRVVASIIESIAKETRLRRNRGYTNNEVGRTLRNKDIDSEIIQFSDICSKRDKKKDLQKEEIANEEKDPKKN